MAAQQGYSPTNFPNGVTSFGILLPWSGGSMPTPPSGGNTWFVSSTLGNNGNPGSYSSPWATLAFAAANTALQTGDVIVLMAGHTENVTAAAGILLSTTGLQVVGQGVGPQQAVINFTGTAAAATVKITGAGVVVQGVKFVTKIITNNQVTCLDIQAKGVFIQFCRFIAFTTGSTTTCLSFIDLVNATANASDDLQITNCYFQNELSAGQQNHAIGLTTVQNNVQIGNNYIYGYWALSGIHNITGEIMTNLAIWGNTVQNLAAATVAMNIISASTGDAWANVFIPGDSTVASAKFGTVMSAVGNNIGINGSLDAGQEFWYAKKGVVCSTITTGGVAVSAASIGGELAIANVILKTDPTTGLAGLATLKVTTNNVNGNPIVMSTTNVGTAATASIVPLSAGATNAANAAATVLESGKAISLTALTTNGTGAGTVDVYVLLQRLTAGANLSQV